jgi:hypothetical protein
MCRPDGRPLPENHHLAANPRGKYVIRAIIDRGAKNYAGHRVTVQTGTDDIILARRIRDAVVLAWIKAGNLTRDIVLEPGGDV